MHTQLNPEAPKFIPKHRPALEENKSDPIDDMIRCMRKANLHEGPKTKNLVNLTLT